MKTTQYLLEMSQKDIHQLTKELTKQQQHLQGQYQDLAMGKMKNYRDIRLTKHHIARLLTLINIQASKMVETEGPKVKEQHEQK